MQKPFTKFKNVKSVEDKSPKKRGRRTHVLGKIAAGVMLLLSLEVSPLARVDTKKEMHVSPKPWQSQIVYTDANDDVFNVIPFKKTPLVEKYLDRYNHLKTLQDIYALVNDLTTFRKPKPGRFPTSYTLKRQVFNIDAALKLREGFCYTRSAILATLLSVAGYRSIIVGWSVGTKDYVYMNGKRVVVPDNGVDILQHAMTLFDYKSTLYISDPLPQHLMKPPHTMPWKEFLKIMVPNTFHLFKDSYVLFILGSFYSSEHAKPNSVHLLFDRDMLLNVRPLTSDINPFSHPLTKPTDMLYVYMRPRSEIKRYVHKLYKCRPPNCRVIIMKFKRKGKIFIPVEEKEK